MTPAFAEAVAPVVRWAKEQGWRITAEGIRDRSFRLAGFDVTAEKANGGHWLLVKSPPLAWWEPASPQQAVDVLCALGHLPVKFSSQWRAGRDVALEALAAAVLLPDSIPDGIEGFKIGARS